MLPMQVRAYAKINWALRITGRRDDGYHDLETLFQTISLHDTLTFREADGLSITCDDPSIPIDDSNLIIRAARAVAPDAHFAVELRKRIPAGGGLGGGSSDAAATLLALARELGIDRPLQELALSLGSDVPFFLMGGTAYARGRGEDLTAMPAVRGVPLLLLMPEQRVATARAFGMLRRFSPPLGVDRYRAMIEDDLLSHAAELVNDFEEPIFGELPVLRALKQRLREAGAPYAAMSGSGSTIVGAFRSVEQRDAAMSGFGDLRAVAAETI
jgi:4-diphosphocytidyl-2-C-methyl-D-erythritol kinase